MKALKIILIVIVSLLLLVILISFALPSSFHIQRSVEVKARPGQAFRMLNNISTWKDWSPWFRMDTNAVYTYTSIESGKGAGYSWKSEGGLGEGSLVIINSVPDSLIRTEMHFGNNGTTYSDFIIIATAEGSKITWTLDGDGKDIPIWMIPISKYFNLMLDDMIGPDFETGLKNIQMILEITGNSIIIGGFDAEIREFAGLNYIGIRNKLQGAEIGPKLGDYYALLQTELKKQNTQMEGPPFTINYAAANDLYDMEAAVSTSQLLKTKAPILSGRLEAGKWLVVKYFGGYDKISPVYQQGFEYLGQNNMKPNGPPMEFYLSDPISQADTSKWLTELVFPFE